MTDVSQSAQVDALVAATVERFGSLDIFISNAGVGGEVLPLLEQTEEEFEHVLSVNLKGAFLCGKAAAKQMIAQGKGGRIIITASIAAIEGGGFHGPYGASKGGIVTLVRTMGREWAQYGITVNAVSPGLTATGINETLAQQPEVLELSLIHICTLVSPDRFSPFQADIAQRTHPLTLAAGDTALRNLELFGADKIAVHPLSLIHISTWVLRVSVI